MAQVANYQHNHAPRSTNDVIGKEKFYFFFFAIVPNKIHTYPRKTLIISKAVLGKVLFSFYIKKQKWVFFGFPFFQPKA